MKQRTTHDDLALYLDLRRWDRSPRLHPDDTDRFTLKVEFVRVDESAGSDTAIFAVRNPDTADHRQIPYSELVIRGYCYITMDGRTDYGMEVVYDDLFCVDLRRAEYMVKLLRQVNRGLAREDLTPRTFGEFCQVVAKILKIDRFVVRIDDGKLGTSYDNMTFAYYHRRDVRDVVDAKVKEFIKGEAHVA